MNGWMVAYLVLAFGGVFIALAKHGDHHAPWNAWNQAIGVAVALFLLYMGGAFS